MATVFELDIQHFDMQVGFTRRIATDVTEQLSPSEYHRASITERFHQVVIGNAKPKVTAGL